MLNYDNKMFQRRHFEAIAAEVFTWDKTVSKEQIIEYLCALFSYYNSGFDESLFIKTCKGEF